MAEVAFVPETFRDPDGDVWEGITRADISRHLPGLIALETPAGGWSTLQRSTGRWSGVMQLGPYQLEEHAIAVDAMLSELSTGEHYTMLPLWRQTWAAGDDLLYATAAPAGALGGTALTLSGAPVGLKPGQFFTVGDPDDAMTLHPRRVRQVVGVEVQAGPPAIATVQQWPPLPQQVVGAGEAAALVSAATHIPARVSAPGSGALPTLRVAGGAPAPNAGSGYGPWTLEWTERVFTGGG